jgi:HlyD family secretion protein
MTETVPAKKVGSWRKVVWATLLGAGALVLVGVLYRVFFYKAEGPKWITAKVTRGDVTQVVSATGTIQPLLLSPVGSQVSGIVFKIHADFNDTVKKGQVLLELDPALFQTAVKSQEANLASAQANHLRAKADAQNAARNAERARALFAKNYISTAERDTAVATEQSTGANVLAQEAMIKQAQASLDKARLDLKNSVILSPVDGIVISRNVELGQAVVASFQAPNLFQIAGDLRKMQVLANVDEADIGHLAVGAAAEFGVDSFRGKRFSARVAQIRNAAQTVQNVVTYVVVLEVNNAELLLRPGMTANVKIIVADKKDTLLVPSAALRYKPRLDRSGGENPAAGAERRRENRGGSRSKTPIYIPDGDRAKPVFATIGITDGSFTEILDGPTEGQVVIVDTQKSSGGGGAPSNPMGGQRPPGPQGGGMRRVGM